CAPRASSPGCSTSPRPPCSTFPPTRPRCARHRRCSSEERGIGNGKSGIGRADPVRPVPDPAISHGVDFAAAMLWLFPVPGSRSSTDEHPVFPIPGPMNFFERQAQARRNTTRLVLLFALAVAGIVVAVDLGVLLVFG